MPTYASAQSATNITWTGFVVNSQQASVAAQLAANQQNTAILQALGNTVGATPIPYPGAPLCIGEFVQCDPHEVFTEHHRLVRYRHGTTPLLNIGTGNLMLNSAYLGKVPIEAWAGDLSPSIGEYAYYKWMYANKERIQRKSLYGTPLPLP